MTKLINRLRYFVRYLVDQFIIFLDGLRIDITLARLKHKYKGIDNIPKELVAKVILPEGLGEGTIRSMRLWSALEEIANMVNQKVESFQVTKILFEWLNSPVLDEHKLALINELMEDDCTRRLVFDKLVLLGDLKQHQVDYMLSSMENAEYVKTLDLPLHRRETQ